MRRGVFLKRFIKAAHELGAIGATGAFCGVLVLLWTAPRSPISAQAAAQAQIAALEKWLLGPSLALVLISGLLAIAANKPFHCAGWAWVKALLGVSIFEGSLLTVVASGQHAAEAASLIAAGESRTPELAELLRTEWGGVWIMLALSLANVVLAVWRPRLSWRSRG